MSWQLPLDRMRVLAALERLSTGEWGDGSDARDVAAAFSSLPEFEPPTREITTTRRTDSGTVEGLTELGTVSVRDERDEWKTETKGGPPEGQKVHIGRFVVSHSTNGPFGVLVWRDFRGEQPLAVDKPPLSRFRLWYLRSGRLPYRLDRLDASRRAPDLFEWVHWLCSRLRYGRGLSMSCWSWETTILFHLANMS